jgi:CRISPR-associated protein Csd1
MILKALNVYYDRLTSAQPNVLPPYGWSWEKISRCIVLNADGSIHHIQETLDPTHVKNKLVYKPKSLMVPVYPEGRTSGVKANYLWDNSAYTLGLSTKPKDLSKKYQAFWANVLALDSTQSKALRALQDFPHYWNKHKHHYQESLAEALDANFVFSLIDDNDQYIHESAEFKQQWDKILSQYLHRLPDGQCLIEGGATKIAYLHSAIKGVDNAQSSGALMVSFNKESFESYGLKQGKNASIGTLAAFKYTTALNYLLRKDSANKQRLKIGDAVTVFWTQAVADKPIGAEEAFISAVINPSNAEETASIAAILQQVAAGSSLQTLRPGLDPLTQLYILGLSPNAARISIRFWYVTTLAEITQNIAQHYLDLQLESQQGFGLPEVWKLTHATAPIYTKSGKQVTDAQNILPQLAGSLARAIFTGQVYPPSLLAQLLIRIRADGVISFLRIALCKAVINRQIRLTKPNTYHHKELSMSLDVNEANVAYRLGRLFAVLESIQRQAIEKNINEPNKINTKIRDRYWGGASATPALVFPSLVRNAMNQLAKLRKDTAHNSAAFFDWQIRDIEHGMPTSWPRSLNLQDQGRFAIGYYHQRYTRKIKDQTGNEVENLVALIDDDTPMQLETNQITEY